MYYLNGEKYVGMWKNNMKNGKGTLTYSCGCCNYTGMFQNDLKEGKGTRI